MHRFAPFSPRSRALLLAVFAAPACFDDPPEQGSDESSSSDGTASSGPTTTATTTTSASTTATTDPDGSGTMSGSDATTDASESSDGGTETDTPPCTLSGTWEVVLDDEGLSGMGAQGRGIVGAGPGTLIANGNADGHWLVRRTEDHGTSWSILDDFAGPSSGDEAVPGNAAIAADGTIYVCGVLGDGDMNASRVVRRSADGTDWETVDDFQLEDGFATNGGSIAIASDGTIFTAGAAGSSQGGRWLVRASDDGGESWTTVDDYQREPGQLCLPHALTAAADGSVLASGHCFDDADPPSPSWIVRRRDGDSWTTVDEQGTFGGFAGSGIANGSHAGTRLYVTGVVNDVSSTHWTVRTSDDGLSWTTFDDYVSRAGQARGIAIYDNGAGTLIATGSDTGPYPTVVTRRSDDDGASWEVIDTYTYEGGIYGGGLSASADGDLYTAGIGLAAGSGLNHWVVRRMACE